MYYFAYLIIIVMAVRCISYGVDEMKNRNFIGGAAAIALALGSSVCGINLFN